jgi:dTDP-4-dehydrorhamnose reductase
MTILITGASGLLGRCLVELLESMNVKYITTYNTRQIVNGYKVNFEDENEVSNFLKDNKISTCINCIVQRQVDICENNWEEIKRININLVDTLSRQCHNLGIYFIHISTDYVFDGKAPPHYPISEVNPLQNYGISKLISEKRVIANMNAVPYTIIRVPVLYSDNIENLSENAVTVIGKKVLNQIETTSEDDYSIRRPVFIPDFCKFILSFIDNPRTGIFHYYNPVDISTKYNTANLIAEYLGKSAAHIKPNKSGGNMANRPYDTELKDDKYDIHKYHSTNLKEGIEKCFKKWKHPDILSNEVFIMFDLDGTILNTDLTHYNAYYKALKEYNIELTWEMFDRCINDSLIDNLIVSYGLNLDEVKSKKLKYMLDDTKIEFIEGADVIINKLIENDRNFVIVTNTSYAVIEHYMNCLPLLRKIKNWVCREDYVYAKPSSNCYEVALKKFYKNEQYKIGFENTINGFNAIENMVDCVYFITTKLSSNYNRIKKEDIYLINDFKHFL